MNLEDKKGLDNKKLIKTAFEHGRGIHCETRTVIELKDINPLRIEQNITFLRLFDLIIINYNKSEGKAGRITWKIRAGILITGIIGFIGVAAIVLGLIPVYLSNIQIY